MYVSFCLFFAANTIDRPPVHCFVEEKRADTFSLLLAWISCWANYRVTTYLRHFAVCAAVRSYSGPLLTKGTDVLPQDLVKFWSREGLHFSNRSEIWQAPQQLRYKDACQISRL